MKKDSPVSEPEKHLTKAEEQIRRLEQLRQNMEAVASTPLEKAGSQSKTVAGRTAEKLMAMRDQIQKPARPKRPRTKIDGKQKSSKLAFTLIKVLEEVHAQDKRLRGSVITRIALNRVLGLENSAKEKELEARLMEILKQLKSK
jgi:hypothetical protein